MKHIFKVVLQEVENVSKRMNSGWREVSEEDPWETGEC